ncbi:MAG: tRNA (adenosine(37)-N6)-threonylcarbamoyltransferase complex dimerization subunit type 1 TsaB [Hyphomicrobiaceae bacterium]
MNILAFDTCFAACSVAVGRGIGTERAETDDYFEPMERGHAERLLPMIAEALAAARLTARQLDRIAVTVGPGTFTGARIGIAAARALALSSGASTVGASSLAVMAEHAAFSLAEEREGRALIVAVDARRGEVYAQLFGDDGGQPEGPPAALTFVGAATLGGQRPLVVVGSGAEMVAAEARRAGRDAIARLPGLLPDAGDLLWLAARTAPSERALTPLYLRPADAKPQMGKSIERAPS